jgi:alpha-glucosidase (family GH31 glycosyl hydrolase)
MRKLIYTALLIFIGQTLVAQNPSRDFLSFSEHENHYEIRVSDGKYRIDFYTPDMVETSFIPRGESYVPQSHAVVLPPEQLQAVITKTKNVINIETPTISVEIQKEPFKLSYYRDEELIISEKHGYMKDSLEKLQFNLTEEEALYGGGARALSMKRRGHRLQLYNRAHYGYEERSELLNYTMPVVVSSKQYMVHFDNPAIGFLDLDSKDNNTLTYETISGRKTYQVVVGDSWLNLIDNYTDLTGKQPMLPRWALGNFSSRFGYHSQEETMRTINKFKQGEIPVDAVVLDIYWFGKTIKGTMGNLAFYRDSFPQPRRMINELQEKNVETLLVTEPFILTTSKRWDEAVEKDILAKDSTGKPYTYDFYFGHTGLIDIFSNKGYSWLKNQNKRLLEMGVTGIWGDLGEPEVHPSDLIHATGTADELHNIYGHRWTKLVKEAFHEHDPNMRPFILMRAGYSGSQRYGIVPWSGDVNRTWGGLKSQPEIALQMGMQGIGYMHSDLGGFAGANLDDSLYVRWMQYGAFQPIYRPHAQEEVPSEPVYRSEEAKRLSKKAIELRYQMLPYNYHLVYQNHTNGAPLMRPLMFEEPDNSQLFHNDDAYLWGDDILVAPIVEKGKKKKSVYFPETSNWYDFYSGEKFEGGQTKTVTVREQSIPTFIRGGAFVPMTKAMQTTKAYNGNELILHYYFDPEVKTSSSELYNDNGKTVKPIKKGKYELMKFNAHHENSLLTIGFKAKTGEQYSTSVKSIELVVHNMANQPEIVKVGDEKHPVIWDEESESLKVQLNWNTEKDKEIRIQF